MEPNLREQTIHNSYQQLLGEANRRIVDLAAQVSELARSNEELKATIEKSKPHPDKGQK